MSNEELELLINESDKELAPIFQKYDEIEYFNSNKVISR